ncbi:transcriptional regulator with XRE-family HTH domain [Paenibacillus sp. 1182]|uniref:helix-turn-helix domain-containing protein n=1 Tax=Paenibacillus sp. 1182 TaxID=2806565 RepID=UPI001B63F703|nr:helix-turn-helix transcriptional regulator [Paenibacillus sp. 1182]MBP1308736.1 transcriptional regulator with XRE-family HTH domain [Paenibacillus sp. 1182]
MGMITINGTKIRELRKSKEMSIKALADELGKSSSTIGMYERGERSPNFETLFRLAHFFSVDVDYFFNEMDVMSENYELLSDEYAHYKKQVLERSKGICELCGNNAPFHVDGQPYLEFFVLETKQEHLSPTEKMVAVCPNCLKKLQILKLPGEIIFLKNKARNN